MPHIIWIFDHFVLTFGPVSSRLLRPVRLTDNEAHMIAMGDFATVCPIAAMMLANKAAARFH